MSTPNTQAEIGDWNTGETTDTLRSQKHMTRAAITQSIGDAGSLPDEWDIDTEVVVGDDNVVMWVRDIDAGPFDKTLTNSQRVTNVRRGKTSDEKEVAALSTTEETVHVDVERLKTVASTLGIESPLESVAVHENVFVTLPLDEISEHVGCVIISPMILQNDEIEFYE